MLTSRVVDLGIAFSVIASRTAVQCASGRNRLVVRLFVAARRRRRSDKGFPAKYPASTSQLNIPLRIVIA